MFELQALAISNLCDSTFCSVKILMQKLLMKMSLLVDHKKAQSIDLSNKICFVQIGQVVPELCVNNFTYINLQWLTNAE